MRIYLRIRIYESFGIFIIKVNMKPSIQSKENLIMRISKSHLQCLISLKNSGKFGKEKSEAIRKMIEMGAHQTQGWQ